MTEIVKILLIVFIVKYVIDYVSKYQATQLDMMKMLHNQTLMQYQFETQQSELDLKCKKNVMCSINRLFDKIF